MNRLLRRKLELPELFLKRIKNQFPEEAEQLIEAINFLPAHSFRINPRKYNGLPDLEKVPWCDLGFYLQERPTYSLDPLLHAGAYYVQESSSMILAHIIKELRSGEGHWNVLDLCAAPGGKSTHILSCLREEDTLVANEVIANRNAILQENLIKWGYPNVLVSRSDPENFKKVNEVFDFIWADAPCSGEGMFRKDPATANEWSLENLEICSLRQKRILDAVWPSLKPGGFLAYSTCTFNPEENELLIADFLGRNSAESVEIKVPSEWGITQSQWKNVYYLQFLPHQSKGEGFFVTVIRKEGDLEKNPEIVSRKKLPKEAQPFENWLLADKNAFVWGLNGQDLSVRTQNADELFNRLYKNLYFTLKEIPFGKLMRQELIPHHALAVNTKFNKATVGAIELNKEDALEFLRKGSRINAGAQKGWTIVTYQNVPLGWIKNLGNRINNYYPVEYRLRMQ